jgi:hypothetical protein
MRIAWPARSVCRLLVGLAAAGVPRRAMSQEPLNPANRAAVAARCAAAERAGLWVRPGVCADRAGQTVTVFAEATGLGTNEPIEFFLISEESAHGYEALAVSFAAPSAVHDAFRHIGLPPGRPVNTARRCYWPKGERVLGDLFRAGQGSGVPLEHTIWNRRLDAPMPRSGLVFTGSFRLPEDHPRHPGAYAADVRGPHAIASNYNEPTTVLDVPRRAPQGSVYDSQFLNPAHRVEAGALLRIVFRPERNPDAPRVADLMLTAWPGTDGPADPPDTLAAALTDAAGVCLASGAVRRVLHAVAALREDDRDPFLSVCLHDATPLSAARSLALALTALEDADMLRLEPPPDGHLYPPAFLPDPAYRDRAQRFSQPWELVFAPDVPGATLVQIEELWDDDASLRPALRIHEHRLAGPDALPPALRTLGPGVPVILVFAPDRMAYGAVMHWIRPVLTEYPTVYIFAGPPA